MHPTGSYGKPANGSCPGCADNDKASWCNVRVCVREHGYQACAACAEFPDPRASKLHNNLMSKIFALVFNSNRAACVERIRAVGREAYAAEMAASDRQSLPRR